MTRQDDKGSKWQSRSSVRDSDSEALLHPFCNIQDQTSPPPSSGGEKRVMTSGKGAGETGVLG